MGLLVGASSRLPFCCIVVTTPAGSGLQQLGNLAILDAIDPFFVCLIGNETQPKLFADDPAKNPRTECCCQSVAAIIAAVVAPAGFRSIWMTRACFVSVRAGFDDTAARLREEVEVAVFRACERGSAFGFDLHLFMGSSEVVSAPSAAPPQPRSGKTPGRARSRSRLQALQVHIHALFKHQSQSFLSKIIARVPRSGLNAQHG